jgi:pimeloyl-ACP methyl ester carboxylesterase
MRTSALRIWYVSPTILDVQQLFKYRTARATTEPPQTKWDEEGAMAKFDQLAGGVWSKGYGAAGASLFNNITKLIPGSTGYPVHYPASSGNSMPVGVTDILAQLSKQSTACPNQKFVLGGHSQGGMVTVSAIPKIPKDILAKVVAVTMFGSPACPADVKDRCNSYCNQGDFVGFLPYLRNPQESRSSNYTRRFVTVPMPRVVLLKVPVLRQKLVKLLQALQKPPKVWLARLRAVWAIWLATLATLAWRNVTAWLMETVVSLRNCTLQRGARTLTWRTIPMAITLARLHASSLASTRRWEAQHRICLTRSVILQLLYKIKLLSYFEDDRTACDTNQTTCTVNEGCICKINLERN